jgi:hypothetical protein
VIVPGHANNNILNYTTSEGIKLYGQAIAPLEVKYDLDSGQLYTFLQKVRNRAIEQDCWTSICTIPVPPTGNLVPGQVILTYSLLTQHGRMTLANVKVAVRTYQFDGGREAQNSHQLFQFLYCSPDDLAQTKLASYQRDRLPHS